MKYTKNVCPWCRANPGGIVRNSVSKKPTVRTCPWCQVRWKPHLDTTRRNAGGEE